MTYLQKMAIIKSVELIESAKRKYTESSLGSGYSETTKLRSDASSELGEATRWLQAIIDDNEEEES